MAQIFDVCIRGDGMVGRTLALLLARQRLRVGLVVRTPSSQEDIRAYSLNSSSRDVLASLRCWPSPQHATPVQHMRVWGDDGGRVRFDSPTPEGLSWIVDVPVLENMLADAVHHQADISCLQQAAPAALTVICEGRHSSTRTELGVEFDALPYPQHAVAARVRGSLAHRQQAFQWFAHADDLDILALLPMGGEQGDSAGVVWSLPPGRAQQMLTCDAAAFCDALQNASHGVLGEFELLGERALWPLQLARAQQWTGQLANGTAWALAGDAAHTIHPLAGLGLNVGLADVAELARVLQLRQTTEYWRPVGDRYFLRRYERARKAALLPTWLACDGLQRLFAHPNRHVQSLRNWGMNGFDGLAPLKRWTMQQAMH